MLFVKNGKMEYSKKTMHYPEEPYLSINYPEYVQ